MVKPTPSMPLEEKKMNARALSLHKREKATDHHHHQQQQQGGASFCPTEAQLRWAQFHKRERVASVKARVENLWQTPFSPSQVEDALSQDDRSSTCSSESGVGRRRSKPKISRGRRALLRVSRRNYESRRLRIAQEGYSCCKENDDELDAMFQEFSVRKKKRVRKSSDEERVQRFEAAYKAMMTNLLQPPQPVPLLQSSKKWTRKVQVSKLSIDGRSYDDLKWGFTSRKIARPLKSPTSPPVDRRASWLVHLPRRQVSSSTLLLRRFSESPKQQTFVPHYGPERLPPISPGKAKFDELVSRLQSPGSSLVSPPCTNPNLFSSPSSEIAKKLVQSRRSFFSEAFTTDAAHTDVNGRTQVFEGPQPKSPSQELLDQRRQYFEKRSSQRQKRESRLHFFKALQAPYLTASAAKKKYGRAAKLPSANTLNKRQHDAFEAQSTMLCRARSIGNKNNAYRPEMSQRISGMIEIFASKSVPPKEARLIAVEKSLFPNQVPLMSYDVAELRNLFNSASLLQQEEQLVSFSKMTAGTEQLEPKERLQAAKAYLNMVTGHDLSTEQDAAFRMFVSGQQLDPPQANDAAAAYRKLIAGAEMTNHQESAYRLLVSGEHLDTQKVHDAIHAYQKVSSLTRRISVDKELAALGMLAAGSPMTREQSVNSQTALKRMALGKSLTHNEKLAFEKLISGSKDLDSEEEDLAILAYRKVVSNRNVTSKEEAAFGSLVEGEALDTPEQMLALNAYSKITDCKEDFFSSLLKLSGGYALTADEEVVAAAAYNNMVKGKSLPEYQELAYRRLIHGQDLEPTDQVAAMEAHATLLNGTRVTESQEAAFRKAVSGQELSPDEAENAMLAYEQIVDNVLPEPSSFSSVDEEDFFSALLKLSVGNNHMTEQEEEFAAAAYVRLIEGAALNDAEDECLQLLISGQPIDSNQTTLAAIAYNKILTGKQITERQLHSFQKLVAGEELSQIDANHAFQAFRVLTDPSNQVKGNNVGRLGVRRSEAHSIPRQLHDHKAYFEQRSAARPVPLARETFLQELQSKGQSASQTKLVKVAELPALVRGNNFVAREPSQSRSSSQKQTAYFGGHISGLLHMFETRERNEIHLKPNIPALIELQESLFPGMKPAQPGDSVRMIESPVAAFRSFFSNNSEHGNQGLSKEAQQVEAIRKMTSATKKLSAPERVQAAIAYQNILSRENFTIEEDLAFRKFVSAQELDSSEASLATGVYRKLVSGNCLDGQREAAFRKLVSGEDLNIEEVRFAVEAYQELSSRPKVSDGLKSAITSEVAALWKLAAGEDLSTLQLQEANSALNKMLKGKEMTTEEDDAYRKLISDDELTAEEEDLAVLAYQKVVSGRCLTDDEEAAYGRLVEGGTLSESEQMTAMDAYIKITGDKCVLADEDAFFAALRQLSGGYVLCEAEELRAAIAYQEMIERTPLSSEHEICFRRLCSGEKLEGGDEHHATEAYRTLLDSAVHLTAAEEIAFRNVLIGSNVTRNSVDEALSAFKKLIFPRRSHDDSHSFSDASGHIDSTSREASDEAFFSSLRKLAAGFVMTTEEEVKAAAAYKQLVYGKGLDAAENIAMQKYVSGKKILEKESSDASAAFYKIVSHRSSKLTEDHVSSFRKLISGEELTGKDAEQAFEAFQKIISCSIINENLAFDGTDNHISHRRAVREIAALSQLAAGLQMSEPEESLARDALQKLVEGKHMTDEQESAFRMLVSGQELSREDEDVAVLAYQRVVFDRGLTKEEEKAYGLLIGGEELSSEDEIHACSAYIKLTSVSNASNNEDNDVNAVLSLHRLAAGQPISEAEEVQAVAAYQRMISCKGLTDEEDASYRKLACGTELTPLEEENATTAYHKVLSGLEMSEAEETTYRKLVSGQELTDEEKQEAISAFRKIVFNEPVDDDPLTIYRKFSSGESLTHAEELRAVAAFKKLQDERRAAGDLSSVSSFRTLPEGIRRVVQSFASPRSLDEDQLEGASSDSENDYRPEKRFAQVSPGRSGVNRSSVDDLSPEQAKFFHQKIMETSPLIGEGDADHTIIDTDDTTSDASGTKMDPKMAASLMLSPTILTKRHQQAIKAIEKRKWDQVSYILNANPWLAEMTDVMTNQYLLHKLAFYGASKVDVDPKTGDIRRVEAKDAPEKLCTDLIRMFPSSVHKFDQDGNLPLHMAAASGNAAMIKLLGERFPSGASVRNNDGFLPLNLAIMSCSAPVSDASNHSTELTEVVKLTLRLFPSAVAVTDNDGNLPLHTAATVLEGDVGVDAIYILMDEAERQMKLPTGVRFLDYRTKQDGDESINTDMTSAQADSENANSETVYPTLIRNNHGHVPLVCAIKSMAGWEVIEALVASSGGRKAALETDGNMCNSLHLLVNSEFADPAAVLSILKSVPVAASIRNSQGMLPIEAACMQEMPHEVVLALLLVDLPIDLDDKDSVTLRDGLGASWWFITCECDDYFVDIVEEVLSICTYSQLRELCFMKDKHGTVISNATPRCRHELRKALRFVGRFEFVGNSSVGGDPSVGLKIFEALDFGTEEEPFQEGRRTLLYCYGTDEETFRAETATLFQHDLDMNAVEEVFDFVVHDIVKQSGTNAPTQFCVAVEQPSLTLDAVVSSMANSKDYQLDSEMRRRYFTKVCAVLRSIAKSIRHLHTKGIVHTAVCLKNCGKFGDKWKLMGLMEVQNLGSAFDPSVMGESSPPECVGLIRDAVETFSRGAAQRSTFQSRFAAEVSIDIWAFGKLVYEVLTGDPLILVNSKKGIRHDSHAMRTLLMWNDKNLREVVDKLQKCGVPSSGSDMILECLMPHPQDRQANMDEIIEHEFWTDMIRNASTSTRSSVQKSSRHFYGGRRDGRN